MKKLTRPIKKEYGGYIKNKNQRYGIYTGVIILLLSLILSDIYDIPSYLFKEHQNHRKALESKKQELAEKPLKDVTINENKNTISYSNNYHSFNKGVIHIDEIHTNGNTPVYRYFAIVTLPIHIKQGTVKEVRYYFLHDDERCSKKSSECYKQLKAFKVNKDLNPKQDVFEFNLKLNYNSFIKNVNKDLYFVVRDTKDNTFVYNTLIKVAPVYSIEEQPIVFKRRSPEEIIKNDLKGKFYVNNTQTVFDMPKNNLANSSDEIIRIKNIIKNTVDKD